MIFEQKHQFKLTDNFCSKYKGIKPDFGPSGQIVFMRTYSRPLPNGKQEDWWQTVKRVVEGIYTIQLNHCKYLKLPWDPHKAQASAREMYDRIFNFKFLPSGRGLYSMGTEVVPLRGAAALFNCAFVSTKDLNYSFSLPFTWAMDMSMCGVGTGFDVLGANKVRIEQPTLLDETYVIDDSREGWCALVEKILDAYVGKGELPKNFDYSKIRPRGAALKTSGGLAPGPDPLINCQKELIKILDANVGKLITSTLIVDLFNIVGKAVVAGGKRRSAQLALGDPNDMAYVTMKDPTKYGDLLKDWRWASNNSVVSTEGMDFSALAKQTAENGEPGYVFLDKCQHYGRLKDGYGDYDLEVLGVNPCGEMTLPNLSVCNIVETFPSRHNDFEDYKRTLKFAYLYAKSTTLVPTHCERTNQVIMRERRIGISQSGIVEAIAKVGIHEYLTWCDQGYAYIKYMDKIYSNWLCIPRSIKLTTVKPSGTVSLLPGVTSGIHYPHSEYYVRRVKLEKDSSLYHLMEKAGYFIEPSAYSDNSYVAEIPSKTKNFKIGKEQVSLWEQLELGAKLQYYWSDNSISQTVTFNESEKNSLAYALDLYQDRLKTVSFLPNKHGFAQAPFEAISEEKYNEAIKKIKAMRFNTDVHDTEEKGCDSEVCELNAYSKKA